MQTGLLSLAIWMPIAIGAPMGLGPVASATDASGAPAATRYDSGSEAPTP